VNNNASVGYVMENTVVGATDAIMGHIQELLFIEVVNSLSPGMGREVQALDICVKLQEHYTPHEIFENDIVFDAIALTVLTIEL
jgi:hypothetical protein